MFGTVLRQARSCFLGNGPELGTQDHGREWAPRSNIKQIWWMISYRQLVKPATLNKGSNIAVRKEKNKQTDKWFNPVSHVLFCCWLRFYFILLSIVSFCFLFVFCFVLFFFYYCLLLCLFLCIHLLYLKVVLSQIWAFWFDSNLVCILPCTVRTVSTLTIINRVFFGYEGRQIQIKPVWFECLMISHSLTSLSGAVFRSSGPLLYVFVFVFFVFCMVRTHTWDNISRTALALG